MSADDLVIQVLDNWNAKRSDLVEAAEFVTWYDSLPVDPNGMGLFDLSIPAYLDAVPDFRALLRTGRRERSIVEQLGVAAGALARVPVNVELWDWEIDDDVLVTLFQATTGGKNLAFPEFGPPKCTKLLHRKRPHLIPVIDSFVWKDWTGKDMPSGWTTPAMVGIMCGMREVLPRHIEELDLVRAGIYERWVVDVSRLRAYDIASYLWHKPPGV